MIAFVNRFFYFALAAVLLGYDLTRLFSGELVSGTEIASHFFMDGMIAWMGVVHLTSEGK